MTTTTITESMLTRERILRVFPDVAANDVEKPDSQSGPELEGYDEEQVRLMEEVCIVLDWNDAPCGSASKKTCKFFVHVSRSLRSRQWSRCRCWIQPGVWLDGKINQKLTFFISLG